MRDTKFWILAVAIVVLAVIVLARPAKIVIQQIKGEPVVGAMTSPDSPWNWSSVGGSRTTVMKHPFTTSTSTPCVITTPPATTTLTYMSLFVETASTTAITWTVATSTTASSGYSTSSASFFTNITAASSNGETLTWVPTSNKNIIKGNSLIVVGGASGKANPSTGSLGSSPTGYCTFIFQAVN